MSWGRLGQGRHSWVFWALLVGSCFYQNDPGTSWCLLIFPVSARGPRMDDKEMIIFARASGFLHTHLPMCLLWACSRPGLIPSSFLVTKAEYHEYPLFFWLSEPRVLCMHSKHGATEPFLFNPCGVIPVPASEFWMCIWTAVPNAHTRFHYLRSDEYAFVCSIVLVKHMSILNILNLWELASFSPVRNVLWTLCNQDYLISVFQL